MKKTKKLKEATVCLSGSEHKEVRLILEDCDPPPWEDDNKSATLVFPTDGMDVTIYMMESDAHALGQFLIKYTREKP